MNYFKVAARNLAKHKVFTAINITGLTLGLTFALLISLWVKEELSYNRFHAGGENIFQVMTNLYWSGNVPTTSKNTPGPLEQKLEDDFPEIVRAVKLNGDHEELFTAGEKVSKEKGAYASPDFFELFSFPLLAGDVKTALSGPASIVISEDLAQKYFQTADAVGKTIRMNQDEEVTVTGVARNVPSNSTIRFDWIRPFAAFEKGKDWTKTWGNISFTTYVELLPGADREAIAAKMVQIEQLKEHKVEPFLQPFEDTYLYSKFTAVKQDGGRIDYVRLFSGIALFVLLLACINFINLATARAGQRARETGIRKVVGAGRWTLVGHFMAEAALTTALAMTAAMALSELFLNSFNRVFDKELSVDYSSPFFWAGALGLCLFTGLVAGAYPAFFLSAFKPVNVLKGEVFRAGKGSDWLRKGLVVFQFTLSIALIIGVIIINRQVHYVKNKNLGIDRKDMIYVLLEGPIWEKQEAFRQELSKSPVIKAVTTTGDNPLNVEGTSGDLKWPEKDPTVSATVSPIFVGDDFTKTMGVELVEGRDFESFPADSASYIVNEAAVRMMGLEDPLGTEIEFWMGKGPIVGVIKDYHMKSLHEAISPMILVYYPLNTWLVCIKPAPGKTEEAIAHVESAYKQLNPGYPFEYIFADEEFEKQYRTETLTGTLANWFAGIAIVISCLGLLGLVIYTAERRTKEIGIRKVVGASVASIVGLLSKEFLGLVLMAILIASPLAWWFMNNWLKDFAYRIDLGWEIFALAGLAALAIAFLTVGFQSAKAALANPIKSLKNE